MKTINISSFFYNPDNPQTVTDTAYAALVKSLRDSPQTLSAMRIAYCTDYVALDGTSYHGKRIVIAGNKRLRALKDIAAQGGLQDPSGIWLITPAGNVPANWFYDLTPLGIATRRAWLVRSNVLSGEWDVEKLLALYSEDELADLVDDEHLAALLDAVQPHDANNLAPIDTGDCGNKTAGIVYIDIASKRVPITPEEESAMAEAIDAYADASGVLYGFWRHLLDIKETHNDLHMD